MSRLAAVLALTLTFAVCALADGDWGDWGDWDGGPLGNPDWWEGGPGGVWPPHGKVPSWMWFFGQGKAGLDGRDGRVGDMGDKGDCGYPGEKGEKGDKGSTGPKGGIGDKGQPGATGPDGCKGEDGQKGGNGVDAPTSASTRANKLYTRWGRTTCPGQGFPGGAQLVYAGRAGTAAHHNAGAGANLVCLSDDFDAGAYTQPFTSSSTIFNTIVGIEYLLNINDPLIVTSDNDGSDPVVNGDNVPCAVCNVVTDAVYMQPGSTQCPPMWTIEYTGFIMAESQTTNPDRASERFRSHYVCVDSTADPVIDANGLTMGTTGEEAGLAHVRADCTDNPTEILGCSTINEYGQGQISCVVCRKV